MVLITTKNLVLIGLQESFSIQKEQIILKPLIWIIFFSTSFFTISDTPLNSSHGIQVTIVKIREKERKLGGMLPSSTLGKEGCM